MNPADAPNINAAWAAMLIEECLRCGVAGFVLSPGSRSTPLTVAAARHGEARHVMHLDERGAAFHALGWARAAERPAALVCTSGTAAANYLPAVIEAAQSRIPLLVLTADRPPELLRTGANQAIVQPGLFGGYTRWQFELPCPSTETPPAMLLSTLDQAVYRAQCAPAGPVHINCMFREPLAPAKRDFDGHAYLAPVSRWLRGKRPWTEYRSSDPLPGEALQQIVRDQLSAVRRGMLIVGQCGRAESEAAALLASMLGWPVLADAASGLRTLPGLAGVVHYHEMLLGVPAAARHCVPEMFLHLGGAVTSKVLLEFIDSARAEYWLAAPHPERHDPNHRVTRRFDTALAPFCSWLAAHARDWRPTHWAKPLLDANAKVDALLNQMIEEQDELSEPAAARVVSRMAPEDSHVFLGNSMPVRDFGLFAAPGQTLHVYANRGASGIDGTLASAAGIARGTGEPVTAVLGDLAVLHDLNALMLLPQLRSPFVLVVVNNGGGGIFSFLPVADYPDVFEKYFGTPHDLSFEHAAAMFSVAYARPANLAEFRAAYAGAIEQPRATLIEVRTSREENYELHQQLRAAAAETAAACFAHME